MPLQYLEKLPERVFAGQADEGPVPWISQPGKHAGWDAVALRSEPRASSL